MAVEGFLSRVTGRMSETALRLRRPARRVAGSVRSAVSSGAIIVGCYNLVLGSVFCNYTPWNRNVYNLVSTSAGFAFITSIMDICLIFGILIKEDKVVKYILCASIAIYTVCVPLSLCTLIGTAVNGDYKKPLWEVFHIITYVLHLGLMYCLLAELRGDLPPEGPTTSPPASEGWLKNNLAHQGPPKPAGDDALLKVHVERNSPAVLAPSSCTTATPVHHPAPLSAATATSGPPSSSEA